MQPVDLSPITLKKVKLVYAGIGTDDRLCKELESRYELSRFNSFDSLNSGISDMSLETLPDVIMLRSEEGAVPFIEAVKQDHLLQGLIVIVLADVITPEFRKCMLKLRVNDVYQHPLPINDICERIDFLVKFKLNRPKLQDLTTIKSPYRIPAGKRLFDIIVSGLLLVILSPLFLVISILILLESKGPVIYKSKRVGTGYSIFNFYKFRSMYSNADQDLKKLRDLNVYEEDAFLKLKEDPRITGVGRIIRQTSLDELPQLYNVFRGDMSLVGNRPLPLYEAEQVTTNEWSMRFLGPAGLTGLWQISKRKEEMSARERKRLDNFYSGKYSFMLDLKILLRTLPAMLQKGNS